MSHFTAMVIGEDPEKQLAPFQENNMEDCPKEYLKFNDETPDLKERYASDSVTMIEVPGGERYGEYDKRFAVLKEGGSIFKQYEYKYPKGHKKVEVPYKELFKSFDEFARDYHGKPDKETGLYGRWENPNSKWDWYQLGGRWTGFFKVKTGAVATVGSPSLVYPVETEEGYADQARKQDIDFKAMQDEAADRAGETYDRLTRLLGGQIPELPESWEEFYDRLVKEGKKGEDIRKEWRALPEMKPVVELQERLFKKRGEEKKMTEEEEKDFQVGALCNIEEFQGGRDKYVGRAIANSFSTFAVLKDGVWYERGEMGWWGSVSNKQDEGEWLEQVYKLVKESPDDTLFSVFDCHV